MSPEQAAQELSDAEVVPCLEAPMGDAKELLAVCLDADIAAMLWKDDAACGKSGCKSGGCGCATRLQILVRPDDLPRVAGLLRSRWNEMLVREGSWGEAEDVDPEAVRAAAGPGGDDDAAAEGEPPCPACGHVAPLAEGACAGCGLQLG